MVLVLETSRLYFRLFTAEDAPLILDLNRDPDVTRYTLDRMTDLEEARKNLEQSILPQYALYNLGRWAVHTRDNAQFIGWCGLKARPEREEIDLGYRYLPAFWGKGYATEAAFACLRFGFEQLGLKRIVGRALPGNKASLRVLEKCGMHRLGEESVDGLIHITYDMYHPSIL